MSTAENYLISISIKNMFLAEVAPSLVSLLKAQIDNVERLASYFTKLDIFFLFHNIDFKIIATCLTHLACTVNEGKS